jgi:hypothetical protein
MLFIVNEHNLKDKIVYRSVSLGEVRDVRRITKVCLFVACGNASKRKQQSPLQHIRIFPTKKPTSMDVDDAGDF